MTASFFVYSGAIAVAVASAAAGLGQDALNDLTDRFIVAEDLRSRPFDPGVFLIQLFGKDLAKEVLVCRGLDHFFDFIRGNGILGWRFWHLYSGGTEWDDGTSGLGSNDGLRSTGLGSIGRLGGGLPGASGGDSHDYDQDMVWDVWVRCR